MKKTFFFLIFIIIISACGQSSHKKSDADTTVADTTVKSEPAPSVIDPTDSLKIRYVPPKVKTDRKTLRQQKVWMEKWETAVKENRQKDAMEALEEAASYDSGEACYKLGEIYKSGKGAKKDQVKSDSLFYYSAIHGYKPGIEWLNSGEGVFMPGGEISMPEFPGGEDALVSYIYKKARKIFADPDGIVNIQGRAVVQFIVEKDGSIRHAKIIRNDIPYSMYIEKDIIDIFKDMPKWEPASWKEQPVRCFFLCPVVAIIMM